MWKDISHRIEVELEGVIGVYLFGSAAAGEMQKESDLDLAVLAKTPLPELQVWELAQSLAIDAGCDVDLVDLRKATTVMRMQVIAYGRRLLCKDTDVCEMFEDFVYSDFARLNEERSGILADVKKSGRVYG